MSTEFESIFVRLREILRKHGGRFTVSHDTADWYGMEAPVGPAALSAWGGKAKRPMIPVAWVKVGKGYVSYHLMAVYGNPKLLNGFSNELKARMQGKSCFNFKAIDEALFKELERLAAAALTAFAKAGYIAEQ